MVDNYIKNDMNIGCCVLIHAASLLRWDYQKGKRKAPFPSNVQIVQDSEPQLTWKWPIKPPFLSICSHLSQGCILHKLLNFISIGKGHYCPLDPQGEEGDGDHAEEVVRTGAGWQRHEIAYVGRSITCALEPSFLSPQALLQQHNLQ